MRAPPDADDDDRGLGLGCLLDRPRNDLADDCAHAAADEGIFHRTHDHGASVQLAAGVDDGVFQSGIGFRDF